MKLTHNSLFIYTETSCYSLFIVKYIQLRTFNSQNDKNELSDVLIIYNRQTDSKLTNILLIEIEDVEIVHLTL